MSDADRDSFRCVHGNGPDCPLCLEISKAIFAPPPPDPTMPKCAHGVPLDATFCRACAFDEDRAIAREGLQMPAKLEAIEVPDYTELLTEAVRYLKHIATALERANERDIVLAVTEAIKAQKAKEEGPPRQPRPARGPDPNVEVPESFLR